MSSSIHPGEDERKYGVYEFVRTNPHSSLYRNSQLDTPAFRLTKEMLRDAAVLRHFPEEEVRYLVSEFDASKEKLFLIPQRLDTVWDSLVSVMRAMQPNVALLIAPLFWQLGPMFYHSARQQGVPVSVVTPRNIPLARQLIQEVGVDMIVCTVEVVRDVYSLLAESNMKDAIKHWHIIAPFGARADVPLDLKAIAEVEYHLFPGIPVARASGSEPSRLFLLPDYTMTVEDTALITSRTKTALPLIKLDTTERVSISSDGSLAFSRI